MNQQTTLQAAKQGNPQAIAALMSRSLQNKGITVKATSTSNCLTITAESQAAPPKEALVPFLKSGITKLTPLNISRVVIRGRAVGQTTAAWQDSFSLEPSQSQLDTTEPVSGKDKTLATQSKKSASFSKLKVSRWAAVLNTLQTRNGERAAIAVGTFLITSVFWLGVNSLTTKQKQPESVAQNVPTSVPTSVEAPSPSPSVAATNAVFTPKDLPVLGTSDQQLQDQATVLDIQVNGKTTNGSSEIPRTSAAGVTPNPIAVKMGYPPAGTDVCNLPYSALIRQMYEQCFTEGMSYVQISNIVGWQGEEVSRTGSSVTYRWGDGKDGSMLLIFESDRLISKSQTGLKP